MWWATGRYHRKVHQCLHDRGFEVVLPVEGFAEALGHLANRVDALAKIGTVLGDLEPVAPQEAFLNCLGDLLVSRAALVDVRTKLRQVADEVDGETVTRASAADLDDRIAGAAIKAVIAGDPEQRYPDLDPRSSDRRSPSLLDARTRQRRQP